MATDSIIVESEDEFEADVKTVEDKSTQVEPEGGGEDDLPEKYRGKSIKDIVEMHRNAESELGRKNNEIGLVRKLADELIGVRTLEAQAALQNNRQQKAEPLTADQLLDNPEDAILRVVNGKAADRTEALEKTVKTLEADLMVKNFEAKHPGFQETMSSPAFGEFVRGSNYRQKLAVAASRGDFDAADDLFGLYEEALASSDDSGKTRQQEGKQPDPGVAAARKASLAKSGGSSASGVILSGDGKKTFTRTELMEMRIKRPDEFDARQDEILAAYREKRVR